MFTATKAFSSFAVHDIEKARSFYEGTLGVDVSENNGLLWLRVAGGSEVLVYPKADHVPASFTVLNFQVEAIDAAVDDLSSRGIRFERYEGLDADEKGIFRGAGPNIAWFTDPSGNILSVLESS
ncbi:MAG TPA: VOC family protein [Acidimicrobiales bacterium]|nr:VOC family protein [Acidimicrobiales bacterium]